MLEVTSKKLRPKFNSYSSDKYNHKEIMLIFIRENG